VADGRRHPPVKGRRYAFVTHNTADFSDPDGEPRLRRPTLGSIDCIRSFPGLECKWLQFPRTILGPRPKLFTSVRTCSFGSHFFGPPKQKLPRNRKVYEGVKLGAGVGFEPTTFRL
jgi:hypothetical protein